MFSTASARHCGLLLAAVVVAGCSEAPAQTTSVEGAQLFDDYCAPCHGGDASGNAAVGAPAIANLPEWYVTAQLRKFRDGGRGTHFDDIEGMRMRPMALALETDQQVVDVSQYVAALPVAKGEATLHGDAAKGKASFGTCTACHQADGSGSQALNAPPLTKQPDWYLLTQIKKFKAGVRGTNPKDKTGATMRPMAATLQDEQAMIDVIAHIQTLK